MDLQASHSSTFILRELSFSVPGRTLLQPLSLTFPQGKVCGLIGHNGSGKSTLLKMLGRHQPPSSGQVVLNDMPLAQWDSKAFAREVAYLPQQLPAAEGMTVRELVAIGRYPWHGALGRFRQEDRQQVEEAIALVDLKPLANRLVDSLSGGERQRAWLAMMVAQNSRCLLLDEPTSALDIAHQVEVLGLIQRLSHERGLTVIAVLHDINMAARYCDHLVALRGGEMIAQGPADSLMQSAVLEQIYGIPMGILPHPAGGAPVSLFINEDTFTHGSLFFIGFELLSGPDCSSDPDCSVRPACSARSDRSVRPDRSSGPDYYRRRLLMALTLSPLLLSLPSLVAAAPKSDQPLLNIDRVIDIQRDIDTKRVVALEWLPVELLLALGVTPFGVADIHNYRLWVGEPALPADVINVGQRTEPNLELLQQMAPSLILLSQGYGPSPEKLAPIAPTMSLRLMNRAVHRWL